MWEGVQNAAIAVGSSGPVTQDVAPPPTGPAAIGANPVRSSLEFLAGSVLRDLSAIAVVTIVLVALVKGWGRRRRSLASAAAVPEVEARASTPTRYLVRGTSEFEIVGVYLRMLAAMAKRGFARAPAETADEFAGRHPGAAVAALTSLFVRARYGPDPLGGEETRRARRLLAEILK